MGAGIQHWHPAAVKLHTALEDKLASIAGDNEEYLRVVNDTRDAIAGAIWEEEERAMRECREASSDDKMLAFEIGLKASGLTRARDIVSGVSLG